jgi:hypothetical protein
MSGTPAATSGESIRLAELMAALSLATDLGVGRPLEHELGVCLAALELARRVECDQPERADVYYVALLAHVGCTGAAAPARSPGSSALAPAGAAPRPRARVGAALFAMRHDLLE